LAGWLWWVSNASAGKEREVEPLGRGDSRGRHKDTRSGILGGYSPHRMSVYGAAAARAIPYSGAVRASLCSGAHCVCWRAQLPDPNDVDCIYRALAAPDDRKTARWTHTPPVLSCRLPLSIEEPWRVVQLIYSDATACPSFEPGDLCDLGNRSGRRTGPTAPCSIHCNYTVRTLQRESDAQRTEPQMYRMPSKQHDWKVPGE
jgi:hypothetical protein